jgi:SynChlorMet cassette radical SAM/SPASM protein ScmF
MRPETAYPLRQIYFYLTSSCNLRCSHCWIGPEYKPRPGTAYALDLDLFVHIIRQAVPLGLSGVKLTGGEPFLHPEIEALLTFIGESDLRLALETNGVLCTPRLAGKIAENKKVFVAVSIDGSDAGTHDRIRGAKGAFEGALNGIRNLAGAGLKPQVIMTVMKDNKDQMTDVVRLAESLGAGSVKFNILQPTFRGKDLHDKGAALPVEEYIRLGRWVEMELSATTRLALFYHQPAAFRPLSRMFRTNGGTGCGSCGIRNIIGVLSDGSYALCGIGEHVKDLVFGHARTDRLGHVWQSNEVLRRLREGLPDKLEGVCGRCLMKHRCLGSCVAQNYYGAKQLWAPYWYCEAAEQEGIFPRSRLSRAPRGEREQHFDYYR